MSEIRLLCAENHPEYTARCNTCWNKELCDSLQALKDVDAEHTSDKEKEQSFSVTKVC
jgi:hypothetical protein